MAADDGSVVVTGSFLGTASFGTLPSLNSAGYQRLFAAKLNSAGNFLWADGFGGTGYDRAGGIAIGADDSVYVAGGFWGTANFDPGAGTYPLTSLGNKDAFLLKLNSSGGFVSAQRAGGTGDDYAAAVAVSATGAVYTTGYFQGTVDFDPSHGGLQPHQRRRRGPLRRQVHARRGPADGDDQPGGQPGRSHHRLADPLHGGLQRRRWPTSPPATSPLAAPPRGPWSATVTGSGTTYDVAVSGMTGSGTVTATIAAGVAQNGAGHAQSGLHQHRQLRLRSRSLPATFNLTAPDFRHAIPSARRSRSQWTAGNARRRQHGCAVLRQGHFVQQRHLDHLQRKRRQRQRHLQLEHHRRGAGHVLHRRLPLVERQVDVLPPHPVDYHQGRRSPRRPST